MSKERQQMSEERAPRRGRKPKREAEGRRRRIPLGAPVTKLTVPQEQLDDDYEYRWINDTVGRINRALAADYEFVEDPTLQVGDGSDNGNSELDTRVQRVVGKTKEGKPLTAFLMRIKKEWYEEDQELKQQRVDEVDKSIRRGQFEEKAGDNRYIPKEGIKIQ